MKSNSNSNRQYQDWILNWLTTQLNLKSDEIEPDKNLLLYGMDSVHAIMLVGDLESHFGIKLPATLIWDYPSVNALVEILASTSDQQSGVNEHGSVENVTVQRQQSGSKHSIDPEEAARLLENIDQLSDGEVESLLKRLTE